MRFVIIGNGAAGNAAACAILRNAPSADVTIISSEQHPFYSRVLTSYFIAGKVGYDGVFLTPAGQRPVGRSQAWQPETPVRTMLSTDVTAIDPDRRIVVTACRGEIPYDRLLLATGGSPVIPDTPGVDLPGVFTLRTLDDAVAIRRWVTGADPARCDGEPAGAQGSAGGGGPAVVLGGGMVGLKAAEALAATGAAVTVVVASESILSQVLDPESARIVQENLERAGVRFRVGDDATAFEGGDRVEAVRLRSGPSLEARTVVVGRGVRPNTGLAKGLAAQVNRGIVVDEFLRTSVDEVYAAGDACEAFDPLRGRKAVNALWTTAVEQGRVAGENMAGGRVEYRGGIATNSLRFGAFCVSSFGDPRGAHDDRVATWRRGAVYRRIVMRDGRIIGAVEIGPGGSISVIRSLAVRTEKPSPARRAPVEAFAEAFLQGNLSFAHVAFHAGVTAWARR